MLLNIAPTQFLPFRHHLRLLGVFKIKVGTLASRLVQPKLHSASTFHFQVQGNLLDPAAVSFVFLIQWKRIEWIDFCAGFLANVFAGLDVSEMALSTAEHSPDQTSTPHHYPDVVPDETSRELSISFVCCLNRFKVPPVGLVLSWAVGTYFWMERNLLQIWTAVWMKRTAAGAPEAEVKATVSNSTSSSMNICRLRAKHL